jgi:carbon monoxide dehydrogenase subunit G
MRFEKRLSFEAPVEEVFALVDNVQAIASCIPGLEELTVHHPRSFDSRVKMSVGPIAAKFQLTTTIEEVDPPNRIVLTTEGKDTGIAGRVKQRQAFELRAAGPGRTDVTITTDIQIQGRLATFGQRIIGARADQFADEVAANVSRLLAERHAAG